MWSCPMLHRLHSPDTRKFEMGRVNEATDEMGRVNEATDGKKDGDCDVDKQAVSHLFYLFYEFLV